MNVALVLRPAVPQSDMGVDDEVADVVLAVHFGTLPSCDGRHTVGNSLWRLARAVPERRRRAPVARVDYTVGHGTPFVHGGAGVRVLDIPPSHLLQRRTLMA